MVTIQKINNDSESTRIQRNMTKTQKKNSNNIKEGKLVNAFVKDPNLSLDETLDTLVVSQSRVELPNKLYEQELKSKWKGLTMLGILSIGVMGVLSGFTTMIKRFSEKKYESSKEFLLPGITRNHCINNEIDQSIFSMIQSPNRKTILAAIGVITLGSMAFLSKTFIDGFKEVFVKKKEADIQKNLQENLIEVETQSFSGKIQIIRSMLSEKAQDFKLALRTEPSFKSSVTTEADDKKSKDDNLKLILIGLGSVLGVFATGYYAIKNIRKSENFIKKGIENTKLAVETLIEDFNKNKPLNNIQGHNGEVVSGVDAYKYLIETMLESIYATPQEISEYVNKMNFSESEKTEFIKYLRTSMNQSTEKVNSAIGGSGRNKITYFSHVNDYLSFFYDWLMNPKNPQFKNLFLGISSISALAYGGKTLSEAVKEIQVKKYNADIELDLQKRLVSTELRNFKAKKESAIDPLCKEFYSQKESGKSVEELKIMADNILFEIKNGPPFVYS